LQGLAFLPQRRRWTLILPGPKTGKQTRTGPDSCANQFAGLNHGRKVAVWWADLQKALYAFTIYGACITPSLVAAIVWERATKQGAIASILIGAVVTLGWNEFDHLRQKLPAAVADLDAVLPAITLSVTMPVVVSLLTRPDDCRPHEQ
jgi:hypothetical protein